MRILHPKRRLKTQAPLSKNAGVVSGVVTCQDKTKAMPNHLAEKKAISDFCNRDQGWYYG